MLKYYKTCDDIILRFINGSIVVSNVFVRNHFQISLNVVDLLAFLNSPRTMSEVETFVAGQIGNFTVAPKTCFSLEKGLVCNPDNLMESDTEQEICFSEANFLIDYMEKIFLVCSDREKYSEYFQIKRSFLDNKHLGNFHQQISSHVMGKLKWNIDEWWAKQKFEDDFSGIRNNPYKFVQEEFLKNYFSVERVSGKKILDIGCGVGYYDKMLSDRGAFVMGIDTNEKYIEQAKMMYSSDRLKFEHVDINSDGLKSLDKGIWDGVLISDVLLFYFVAPNLKNPPVDVVDFMKAVGSMLKPDGNLYVMDPHGVFFLQGWYGAAERPYVIMTEYRNRVFRVVPTLEELSHVFSKAGFLIKEIFEPKISREMKEYDPRAYHFCSEFPIWWFFNLVKEK